MRRLNLVAVISLIFLISFSGAVFADDEQSKLDEEAFLDKLQQIDVQANRIEHYAGELDSYVRSPLGYSWETHVSKWNRIANRLNEMARVVEDLEDIEGLNEWHEQLIRRIKARMVAMSDQTNDAIDLIERDRRQVEFGGDPYKARVAAVHVFADNIDRLADYGKTRWELTAMEEDIS